jgi:predicted nucleic acid-binding protein
MAFTGIAVMHGLQPPPRASAAFLGLEQESSGRTAARRVQTVQAALSAPLIDAEISSLIRGLAITTKPTVRISEERALEMLHDYAGLRIVRHAMQPLQARAFEMRNNFTAYDAMYVALAERLNLPLLTDDTKVASAPGHHADICRYPALPS